MLMTKTISVRRVTWKYLTIMLVISLLGIFLIARMGWQAVDEDMQRHHEFETNVLQRQFSELIGFYQGVANQLSKGTEVADILEFGDRERAMLWAREVRRLIPESIGAALIDSEGTILGEPLQLNLGTQCVSDLQHMFAGKPVASPPVHRSTAKLSHFDITNEVRRNGEVIGVLFLSFSLNVIQRRAEQLLAEGQVLLIEDGDGVTVAAQGSSDTEEHVGREHPRVAIDNTDWKLHFMSGEYGANALFVSTLLGVGLFLIITIVVMVVLSLKLIALFKNDLDIIKEQLGRVYSGRREKLPENRTVLSETSNIMDDVWELMGNIELANAKLKELSVNDELSGLLNRRGFNDQLEQNWEMSARGVTAYLVLLDLDYFKQVNDRYGHGTGDEVIVALARALRERCRKTDIIARLGGDEFAVILTASLQQESVEQWYHQLTELFNTLQAEIFSDVEAGRCSISAGAVQLDKGRYDWLQKQIDVADRALYKAKEQGRSRIICEEPKIPLSS